MKTFDVIKLAMNGYKLDEIKELRAIQKEIDEESAKEPEEPEAKEPESKEPEDKEPDERDKKIAELEAQIKQMQKDNVNRDTKDNENEMEVEDYLASLFSKSL